MFAIFHVKKYVIKDHADNPIDMQYVHVKCGVTELCTHANHFNLEECIGTLTAASCSGVGSSRAFSMKTRYSSEKYLSESVGLLRSDTLTYTQSCPTSTLTW